MPDLRLAAVADQGADLDVTYRRGRKRLLRRGAARGPGLPVGDALNALSAA